MTTLNGEIDLRAAPYGLLLLRLVLGTALMVHFLVKLLTSRRREPLTSSSDWACPAGSPTS